MSEHTIILDPQPDGSTRAVDARGNVWYFDIGSTHELFGVVLEQSDHGECGSDTLMMDNTIMGEHIER